MNISALFQSIDHDHEESVGFWDEVMSVTFDPAHMIAEWFWGIVFAILTLAVQKLVFTPIANKRLHKTMDKQHGIEHEEQND